jgi:hypothetical protein
MRSAGNLHPPWGYVAPERSVMHTVRVVLVATVIGAIGGAAVVGSLVERPEVTGNSAIAARALLTGGPLMTAPAAPAKAIASTSRPSTDANAREPNGAAMPTSAPVLRAPTASAEIPSKAEATAASATARADVGPETSPAKSSAKKHHLARSDDRKRGGRHRRLFDSYGERGSCCNWRQETFGSIHDNW